MKTKVKYTKRFMVVGAVVLSLGMTTGCGNTAPPEEISIEDEQVSGYLGKMGAIQTTLAETSNELSALLDSKEQGSEEWLLEVSYVLKDMSRAAHDVYILDPPPSMVEHHTIMTESADSTVGFVEAFVEGYAENDTLKLEKAFLLLKQSRLLTEKASESL